MPSTVTVAGKASLSTRPVGRKVYLVCYWCALAYGKAPGVKSYVWLVHDEPCSICKKRGPVASCREMGLREIDVDKLSPGRVDLLPKRPGDNLEEKPKCDIDLP